MSWMPRPKSVKLKQRQHLCLKWRELCKSMHLQRMEKSRKPMLWWTWLTKKCLLVKWMMKNQRQTSNKFKFVRPKDCRRFSTMRVCSSTRSKCSIQNHFRTIHHSWRLLKRIHTMSLISLRLKELTAMAMLSKKRMRTMIIVRYQKTIATLR